MKRWLVTLCAALMFLTLITPFLTAAQTSPLYELQVTITDYESEKVMPGSTFKVKFTVHKPAGIRVTDGLVGSDAFYWIDNQSIDALAPVSGSSKPLSLSSFDEQDENGELNVKILENVPVGQSIYIRVAWYIADVNVSIGGENENLVTVVSGENVFTAPVVHKWASSYTRYYIVDGINHDTYVRSDRSNRLYVVGILGDVVVQPISAVQPTSFDILAVVVGIVIIVLVLIAIFVINKKR